jgi:hypothetical protein
MNLSTDPILRKRVMTMVDEIYRKCVIPPGKANSMQFSLPERKAIDRSVVKYLETAKYVREAFHRAVASLAERKAAGD